MASGGLGHRVSRYVSLITLSFSLSTAIDVVVPNHQLLNIYLNVIIKHVDAHIRARSKNPLSDSSTISYESNHKQNHYTSFKCP